MIGFPLDVVVIGGCGRAGLPLALAFASRGLHVGVYDINESAVALVNAGCMPFEEDGAAELLDKVAGETLTASSDPAMIGQSENLVLVIGTPVESHLDPDPESVPDAVAGLAAHLRPVQLLVLRSTLYPGVTARVEARLSQLGLAPDVVCCPERLAEGRSLTELFELPQLIGARSEEAHHRAAKLFGAITAETLALTPEEAELAKLFTNSYRYLKFAAANQLYEIANDHGVDYERVRRAVTYNYPRAADLPKAGFAAGPCLFKDTMQLSAFTNNNFVLGHASMMVNEGLPQYLVNRMAMRWDLSQCRVGILGMAFKADTDDIRSSLSYKLKRILRFRARSVLCTDPYVSGPEIATLEEVLAGSDLLVVGAPHRRYVGLSTPLPVVDVWGVVNEGVRV